MISPEQLQSALAEIDAANAADPRDPAVEPAYAHGMSKWLAKLDDEPSPALQIAARAQHLKRWEIPRRDYPQGKRGYHQWRRAAARYHAEETAKILRAHDVAEADIARVQALIRKEELGSDPEAQTLEDAACLTFLDQQFATFADRHDDAKLVHILRRTWRKMSPTARDLALAMAHDPKAATLLDRALETDA